MDSLFSGTMRNPHHSRPVCHRIVIRYFPEDAAHSITHQTQVSGMTPGYIERSDVATQNIRDVYPVIVTDDVNGSYSAGLSLFLD